MEREALKQTLLDMAARAELERWLMQSGRSQLCEPRHQSTVRHCGSRPHKQRGDQEAHEALNRKEIFQIGCVDVEWTFAKGKSKVQGERRGVLT